MPAVAQSSFLCAIEKIRPWPGQPRKANDPVKLAELAGSIQHHGVLEPLVVRRVGEDEFELVMGERRWRAAQLAGLKEVPVIVREFSDDDAFEAALTENIARETLSMVEMADGFRRLQQQGLSQVEIGRRVGLSQAMVWLALATLDLPAPVLDLNRSGKLTGAHLSALKKAPSPKVAIALAKQAVAEKLSAGALSSLVLQSRINRNQKPAGVRDLEMRLSRNFGMKVELVYKGNNFMLRMHGTLDQLDEFVQKLATSY